MFFADIQPHDVYQNVSDMRTELAQVREELAAVRAALHTVLTVLTLVGGLVVVQLFAKFAIFSRVIAMLRRSERREEKTDRLLSLVERQGATTDQKANKMEESAQAIAKTAPKVLEKVEELPRRVVDEMKKDAASSSQDGTGNGLAITPGA